MTSPKPLIEEGTPFDRELLRAGREDRPPRAYERRVIAAVGLMPAAAAELASPSLLTRLVRPRFLAVAASAAIAAGAAALAFSSDPANVGAGRTPTMPAPAAESTTEQSRSDSPAVVAAPTPGSPAAEPRALVVATTTPETLPSAPTPTVARRSTTAPASPPRAPSAPAAGTSDVETAPPIAEQAPVTSDELQREVELLDAVKRSLRRGAHAEAERALDAYDAELPRGTLMPEAGFLRVRLLLAQGDRARAASLGEALLRRYPGSVHAKRIRAALTADGGGDQPRPEAPPP